MVIWGKAAPRGKMLTTPILVRQVSSIFQPNCAFCEESTKFGTLVQYHNNYYYEQICILGQLKFSF